MGKIVKVRDLELSESSNKSPEPLLDLPATSEHMSVLLPAGGEIRRHIGFVRDYNSHNAHLSRESMRFDVIMQKVHYEVIPTSNDVIVSPFDIKKNIFEHTIRPTPISV